MIVDRRWFLSRTGASLALLTAAPTLPAQPAAPPLLLGTDYYPDQTPESLWAEDATRMAALGITNVRIAEFAWGLMEPTEGAFDFAWLHRSVDILHRANIAVILGTPSAAPPPWLSEKYPEILEKNSAGVTLIPGTRRFTCPSNQRYRDLSLRIATEMARSFANTPGVFAWQIDNELTLGDSQRCFCESCRTGFQTWLQTRYGTLAKLNDAWGTVFWSNLYTSFQQIHTPLPSGAPPNPAHALDYDRYQSEANVAFLQTQLTMLRRLCPRHLLTTNNVAAVDVIVQQDLYANLDFAATDNYPGFAALYASQPDSGMALTADQIVPAMSWSLDMTRAAKSGKPFLVMEQQSGKAGQPIFSPQPAPGQLRLWTYQTIAHGAMGVNYFRWDTANFGAEEYWHGLLRHDRSESPGFQEIAQTIRELKTLGAEALHADYAADAALLFDYSSDWALTIQPGHPKLKYQTEIITWYGVASAGGALLDIVDGTHDLSRYKVLFAPTLYVLFEPVARQIEAYVQQGGTFIAGCRLGVKDEHSRMGTTPLPGRLRTLMGVTVEDYVPIYSEKLSVALTGPLQGPEAACDIWADVLHLEGATALATYAAGTYAGKPAITTHTTGKGKAIYIGAHLEPAALARVLITLSRISGISPAIQPVRGVEITTRRSGPRTWTYLLNHTPQPQTLTLKSTYKDALTGTTLPPTHTLPPYGATVLTQTT